MRRILVTGAGGAAAANFVHSLRLAPEPFFVVGSDTSKYHLELAPVDARYLLPRAEDPGYLDELNALVEKEELEVVHPQPEQEVLVLARERRRGGGGASLPVSSPDQAVAWVRYWSETRGLEIDDFMVSEMLPGAEFAFQSLWLEGELVTSAARQRLEYVFGHLMPSGQSSSPSVARTVHREDVNELATRAVQAVDRRATGVFCVDLKEDADGSPLVTEINAGRFFTTSNFLAEAGANMPYEYVRMALGERPEGLARYDAVEPDLYWIRMIDMGYKSVRKGEWRSKRVDR